MRCLLMHKVFKKSSNSCQKVANSIGLTGYTDWSQWQNVVNNFTNPSRVNGHVCPCYKILVTTHTYAFIKLTESYSNQRKGLEIGFTQSAHYTDSTCSDQHVKYSMLRGFLLTSNLLLNYHVKQYPHICLTTHWTPNPICCS